MTSDLEPSGGPSPRSAQLQTVDFGSATRKRAWVDWCAERGLVAGKRLRELAEREMAGSTGAPVHASVKARPDERNKIETRVYLTPSEHEAIGELAPLEGYGFPEWIIAAVRARLTGEPSYGQAELEALRESNAHLAEVVLELAAWRRQEPDGDVVGRVLGLENEVRAHVEQVSKVMAQGVRRWQVKA